MIKQLLAGVMVLSIGAHADAYEEMQCWMAARSSAP